MVEREEKKVSAALAARGYSLSRFVTRTTYARNGNIGHPTKEWCWVLARHGKPVGSATTRRGALAIVLEE